MSRALLLNFLAVIVIVAILLIAAILPRESELLPDPLAASASPSPSAGASSLAVALERLPVSPEPAREGYSRDRFRHWLDADGDGCDAREEVLRAESIVRARTGTGCKVLSGEWLSAYDGASITDPGALDIDHVVPLAEAWDSGAASWTDARRSAYANDLGVPYALIAVSAASNRSKADQDPAEWLPDEGYRCEYAAAWIAVKVRWSLAVDPAEHDALANLVAAPACASTALPDAPAAP